MNGIRDALCSMLGADIGVGVADPRDGSEDLWPQEVAAIAQAVPKRRAEFAAGRRAARAAMADLELPAGAIRHGPDRAPVWPDGVTGSIAHCETCAVALVARQSGVPTLGVDVEPATGLAVDLIEIVCTSSEQAWIATQPDPNLAATLIFSAKEAVYKAQYAMTKKVIGFDAVTLEMTDGSFITVAGSNVPDLRGSFLIRNGLILSVAHV